MEGNTFAVLNKLLNDSTKNYIDKVEGLLLGWKSIYSILFKKPTQPYDDAMNYMHKSTLQYLLHGDWTQLEASLRAKFTVILHKVLTAISKTDQEALRRCKLLIKLVHEPWKNSTLHKILHSLSPTDNEVREYIATEGSELLLMRLEVLCEGKCEDLALKLAATLLKHLRLQNCFKKTDIDYISDTVLILLFRFKRNQEIIDQLKNLDLMEGLDLVKRFARKHTSSSGLWRFCDKVTEIAAHTVLASGMVQNVESKERQSILYELVNEWALIHIPKLNKCVSTLCNMVRKIVQKAESPIHVYIFAQVLHKQLGDQVKPLCIELYIRGFTSNINLIERYKSNNDNERTLKAEILLSNSFLELSELLQDNIIIHRECILTAFSLHPTQECFKRLENAALLCCEKCKNEEKDLKTDSGYSAWNNCDNISCVHAREKTEEQFIEAVNSLNILNSDLLGLAPHLCDDLSTVLCSPRCQTLSWSLGWSRLKKQCEKYLVDHFDHKPRCTELKYLNIDYSQFEKSSNKCNQSLRKYRKKKLNKEFNSNCTLNPQKKISYGNIPNNHKRVIDKNILNYSMMKINDILFENYKVYNSLSDDSNDSNTSLCHKMYSTSTNDAASFLSATYLPKSKTKSDKNIKNISYYQSNEGSVLSCSNNNNYDEVSSHSPKQAEVPPATFDDTTIYHEKIAPFIKSVAGKSNYLLADLLSKSTRIDEDEAKKTELVKGIDKCNLLSRTSLQSDMLLAKYIPGMNSLDLIVPLRPEPTVQVVQIPSPNSILQPVSSNSSSAIQTSSTTISIAKPLTEPVSTQSTEIVATQTQTPHTQVVDANVSNSNLLLTTVVNQGTISRIHGTDQRHSSIVATSLTGSRNQNKSSELSSSSETVSISSEPVNALVNASLHEGSTQVTAHIQRVGQPQKQKLLFEESNLKSTSTQNSNVHIPGNIQVYEEPSKHSQSGTVSGSVYRFILKDGKILEQYCHSNQNSAFPLPDVLNESSLPGTTQQEHVIKLYKKKKEVRKDDNGNSENIQVPSLPQFHQAFRRQVYQSGSIIEGTSITATSPRQFSEDSAENSKQESISSPLSKAVQTVLKDAETSTKCSEKLNEDSVSCASTASSGPDNKEEVNDLQSPSGVIFTCKVPISLSGNTVLQAKPVTILKATTSQECLGRSSQKSDCDSKSKDSVIRSNMNALLAAALQNSPVKNHSSDPQAHSMKQVKVGPQDIKTENSSAGTNKLRMPSPTQKSIRRPTTVQPSSVSSRFSRPPVHSSGNQNAPPVVTIPLPSRAVQVLTTNVNSSITNVPKVDNRIESAQLPQNSEQTSVSSTTLEQLREFESVLEQVTNTSQMKERGNAKRTEVLVPTTTAANSDFSSPGSSKVNTLFQTSLVSAISDLNSENRLSLTFISKASTTCTNTLITGSSPKITATTPVVVVQSCSRPLASPALSIASQNSPGSSPSTPPANSQPKINTKLSKPKTKSIGKTAPTTTLKVSTLPKPQQKPQEDEQTTQRIYAILDKYAEQLRNSPELKNKPAPRRRSNPPTNPSQSSKRKKSSQNKSKSFSSIPSCSGLEMSPGSEDLRTAGSEDSSNGVCQVTQTVNSPLSRSEEHSNPGGDLSSDVGDSVDKDQRLQHRILLADQSGGSSRTVIVQDNVQPVISVEGTKVIAGKQLVVGSSTTVPLTLSLPGTGNVKQVLFPVPADGRPFVVAKVPKMYRFHQVTMPSGSPLIASASSGTVLLRQMCLNKSSSTLKQVKLPVVSQISTHMASQPTVVLPSGSQSFTLSTGSSIDSDSLGIALDNTILLNSSSAPASSLGFVQRNISKSNQSSNILSQNRQMVTQESSTNSSGSEVATAIKTETIIKTENLSGDTSRTSDSCDDFKSEDVKFSIESNNILHDKSSKGVSLISSPSTNNNWVQVFKEANSGNNILNKVEEKIIPRKETLDSKGSDHFEKSLDRRCPDDINCAVNEQTNVKQKLVDTGSYCIEGIHDTKSIINNQLNDHWQFNIKLEKVCNPIKNESLSPCLRDAGKEGDHLIAVQQSPLTQSQGLKRKVENTIFQIAFKRDKLKLSKDDFIQQRSAIAIERELRLQKSLSEECEDLGVDKPSTSDLFPEAELLLDPDPLSRDSLQGELFPRAESSSSSLSSPNRSPIFTSKCTNSWRKQKRSMLRHKFSYARSSSPSKKNISDKTDSSRESTPINLNSGTSKNLPFDVKHSDSNFKCISKENESGDNENDITIECNDSDACNFSDVEDHNDTDILDTEGESDNDFIQKSQEKNSCNSSKELDTEKSIQSSLLRRLSDNTFSKCDYYLNKDPLEKRAVENSPWYHMIKGIQKETLDSEADKSNHGEDMTEPHNGVLNDYEDHQRSLNNYVSNKILHARKRKKVGLFLASPSEDSGSSIDTILAGSDSCSGFHDLSKRSSSRGRVKKGCPCFNGSPEPTKKKKDIPVHDKTDKPCSTKTSFPFSNKKQVGKSTVKLVNRKR